MSNYVIGLTGGIACGKTNLTRALLAAGAPVIDADEISRSLTASGGSALPAIRAAWGDRVFDGEELNRRALSDIVFKDPEERKKLNAILHPLIFSRIRQEPRSAFSLSRPNKANVIMLTAARYAARHVAAGVFSMSFNFCI